MQTYLTVAGLVINFFGAAILFRYGPPQPDFREGDALLLQPSNVEESRRSRATYKLWSRIGFALLAVGFLLQLAGELWLSG